MKKTILLILLLFSISFAQTNKPPDPVKAPKIFVSGNFYDMQYLKEQIPVVDYVIDRKDADVHILITSQSTGSGGSLYTMYFYGQNQFDKMNDTLTVVTDQIDSQDNERGKITRGIKTGLFNYLRKTGVADMMTVGFINNKFKAPEKKEDPWNSWVFRASFNGHFNGESSSKSSSMYGTFSAGRTTEDLRLSFSLSNSYSESSYSYDIMGETYDFKNITRSQNLGASAVAAISDHWSFGSWGSVYKSTYGNIDFEWGLTAGIEYSFFPYSESTQKQLRFVYKTGINYNKYFEETIYFKESEYLAVQSASLSLSLTQPWGNVSMGIYASNYWQDMNKYDISFSTYLSLKLFKGVSINGSLSYSKINNQLSLARRGASVEDVLLRIRQLETNYQYYASVGVSFSFGSIFNSIVNPRFGGGGSGMVMYYD